MTGAIKPDTLTSYRVRTDEELKRSSLPAARLVGTLSFLPTPPGGPGSFQAVPTEAQIFADVARVSDHG
jgi:hypothetical protein